MFAAAEAAGHPDAPPARRDVGRKALTQLREGQELAFELDGAGQLKTLRFDRDANSRVDLKVAGDSIVENVQLRPIERRVEIAAGTITRSLYADGARAGLSSGAINEMANIFKYDIDFVEDVRDGDTFQVVYEDLWRDGQRVGTGERHRRDLHQPRQALHRLQLSSRTARPSTSTRPAGR